MKGSALAVTASAVVPKDRAAITGFRGLLSISRTGAKFKFTPIEASSVPTAPPMSFSTAYSLKSEQKRQFTESGGRSHYLVDLQRLGTHRW
jgi:hypothetical protein